MRANTMDARSQTLPRLTAEMIPIGIPTRTQVMAAPTASVIVTGRRLKISSLTGVEVREEEYRCSVRDRPRPGDPPLGEPSVLDVGGLVQPERVTGRRDVLPGGLLACGSPCRI